MFLKRLPVLVSNSFPQLNGFNLWFSSGIALVVALAYYPSSTLAQSVLPSRPGLSFQTSGPARGPNIGDWYTTTTPDGFGNTSTSNDRVHRFFINVTAADLAAAGGSIVITVNDAESNGALDEVDGQPLGTVGGTPDPTRFQLLNAAGTVISSRIIPSGSANGTQINFPPITTPGTYQVTSVTGAGPIFGDNTTNLNDDDNSFSISVPISGLLIGQFQGSFQRSNPNNDPNIPALDTIPFYFLVGPGTNGLALRNFDLDVPGVNPQATISYTNPSGTIVPGTTSNNAVWNGGGNNLNTGQDNVPVGGIADAGTWTLTLGNYSLNNQGILEVNDAAGNRLPVFDTRPTRAGNFTITTDTTLTTKIGTEVCHPFDVTNNFFTTDIINLTPTGTDPNYTAIFRAANNNNSLVDTDGDGVVDTGILQPGQTRRLRLCVTPNPTATTPDTTRINGISFMDRKIRRQANNPEPPTTVFVTKTTSIDPATSTGEPRLRLVKRITGVIRNGTPLNSVNFGNVVADPIDPNSTAPGWAALPVPGLVGVVNLDAQTPLQSGDQVEYTVYFLSDGNTAVTNARVCDLIPEGTTFDPNSFGSGQGIFWNAVGARTNAPADDQGTFFSGLSPVSSPPCANSNNPTGAVLVELGNVNPQQAGLVRFRVRIN